MRLDPLVKEKLKKAFSDELALKRSVVRITAGYPLTNEEIQEILKKFPAFSKSQIETQVDTQILGGFILQIGSKVIDLSIRHALHTLHKKMYESN